jgi:hypothetical protein
LHCVASLTYPFLQCVASLTYPFCTV